ERAAAADPRHVEARIEAARDLLELDRPDDAERNFEAVLGLVPEHVGSLMNLGFLARRRGDHMRSLSFFERAAIAEPGNAQARTEVGAELRKLGRHEEAASRLA